MMTNSPPGSATEQHRPITVQFTVTVRNKVELKKDTKLLTDQHKEQKNRFLGMNFLRYRA